MKEPKIPQYWKRIWRDSRLPHAAKILLMEMKLASKIDVLRTPIKKFAEQIGWKYRTVEDNIAILRKYRCIRVQNNSRRGDLCESTYFIDDRMFAKFLSETAKKKAKRGSTKIRGGVPSVLKDNTRDVKSLPDNVILMVPKSDEAARCRL